MHGQYIRSMDRHLIRGEDMLLWLSSGELKGETDSEIIAAQDQALPPNIMQQKYYTQKQTANVDCKQFDETVEQIISGCPVLAEEQYIKRNDTVCAELHCNICKEIRGKFYNKQRYDHLLKLV
jgi:hypothetical protein